MTHREDRVWLIYENVYAALLWQGAHASLVQYNIGGIDYKVYVENSEYIEVES